MPELPVVIVLAAGRGERFAASGGTLHKLDALLAGKPVLAHVLDAVKASGLTFQVVRADASRPGMGDSIAAGIKATADAAGWLILPGDLPLIHRETLRILALAPHAAVTVPVYQGRHGHPVRFDRSCMQELLSLKGNEGAARILRTRGAINSVAFMTVNDVGTVQDVDTLADLARAEALLAQRAS